MPLSSRKRDEVPSRVSPTPIASTYHINGALLCITANGGREMSRWVISRHSVHENRCPLYSQKQTATKCVMFALPPNSDMAGIRKETRRGHREDHNARPRPCRHPGPMSALGQKQTSGQLRVMSALPPKADIEIQTRNVR